MPIHDWTRVDARVFHDFHLAWIAQLRTVLNTGLLPPQYYALAERVAGDVVPDVLTLERQATSSGNAPAASERGGIALADLRPQVQLSARARLDVYAPLQRQLVIRRREDDRMVALLELVSSGNKHSQAAAERFILKGVETLRQGYHLTIIDLYPPTPRQPIAFYASILEQLGEEPPAFNPTKPLSLVSFGVHLQEVEAFIEPVAIGDVLKPMPVFLDPGRYINLPLEATYLEAWQGLPQHFREQLENP